MVRGRRIKNVEKFESLSRTSYVLDTLERTDRCSIDKLLKKTMERNNEISPPITRSRKNARLVRTSIDSPPKNGHITSYFQIVSSVDCFENGKKSDLLDDEKDYSIGDDYRRFEATEEDNYEFDIDILCSEKVDEKSIIINNIFKKDNYNLSYGSNINGTSAHCRNNSTAYNGVSIKEETFDQINEIIIGNEGSQEDEEQNSAEHIFDSPNVRLSPRKHASTLQRCDTFLATVKENIKTPHRISLCHEDTPSHSIRQLNYKHRTRRRIKTKPSNKKLQSDYLNSLNDCASNKLDSEEEKHCQSSVQSNDKEFSKNNKLGKTNGSVISTNHKLTEYFPVRRSVRKTKKEVMEQKRKDLEFAILENKEEGLEIASFEGKGRGIVASRPFRRGDFVVEYAGELVDIAEARSRETRYAQDHTAGCYMYYFRHNNLNYCIDATAESGRLGRLVNHSRNGNLITKTIYLDSKPHLVLIANQDISTGEEVTYDYGDRSKESLQHHPWLAL